MRVVSASRMRRRLQVRSLPVAAPPSPDGSWRARLLGDLWLFLAVLAVGLTVAVVAALI